MADISLSAGMDRYHRPVGDVSCYYRWNSEIQSENFLQVSKGSHWYRFKKCSLITAVFVMLPLIDQVMVNLMHTVLRRLC